MAFEVLPTISVETPEATLVTRYAPFRIGVAPVVDIDYAEVKRMTSDAFQVSSSIDEDQDGIFEKIVLIENVSSLVGTEALSGSISFGTVTAINESENAILVSSGSSTDLTGSTLYFGAMSVTGTPAWRYSGNTPRLWTLRLDGNNPAAMEKIGMLLGSAYVAAVHAAVEKLSPDTFTLQQIQTAVYLLSLEGTNIDSFLAQQAELLEIERRDGNLPFVQVINRG